MTVREVQPFHVSLRRYLNWVCVVSSYHDLSTTKLAVVSQSFDSESEVLRFATMSRHVIDQTTLVSQLKTTIGHPDVLFMTVVIKFRVRAHSAYISHYNTDLMRAFFGNTSHLTVDMIIAAHSSEGIFLRYTYVALSKMLDVRYLHRMVCRIHRWLSDQTRLGVVCVDGGKLVLGTDIAWTCTLRDLAQTLRDNQGLYRSRCWRRATSIGLLRFSPCPTPRPRYRRRCRWLRQCLRA